jgi:hypothetical protein
VSCKRTWHSATCVLLMKQGEKLLLSKKKYDNQVKNIWTSKSSKRTCRRVTDSADTLTVVFLVQRTASHPGCVCRSHQIRTRSHVQGQGDTAARNDRALNVWNRPVGTSVRGLTRAVGEIVSPGRNAFYKNASWKDVLPPALNTCRRFS